MRPEDTLHIQLPSQYARLTLLQLINQTFPDCEADQSEVEALLDVRDNPDLPDIHHAIGETIHQWRSGFCALHFSLPGDQPIDLADPVKRHLRLSESSAPADPSSPILDLTIEQEFKPLDYALAQGFWESREELLEWLTALTLLYFIDKHEYQVPITDAPDNGDSLSIIAKGLGEQKIIAPSEEQDYYVITRQGRQFIGNLLAETESYIDQYDVFKDVDYDHDAGLVEFENNRGEDLRVQVFVAEGLDPIRVVFLLRMYDGTLDDFTSSWARRISDDDFFEEILEPVVNRSQLDNSLIEGIVERGYVHLEEQAESSRAERSRNETLERLREN